MHRRGGVSRACQGHTRTPVLTHENHAAPQVAVVEGCDGLMGHLGGGVLHHAAPWEEGEWNSMKGAEGGRSNGRRETADARVG